MQYFPDQPPFTTELEPVKHELEYTFRYVKNILDGAEAGHDWHHVQRVYQTTLQLLAEEAKKNRLPEGACLLAVWGALLHDVADDKFHPETDSAAQKSVEQFIEQLPFAPDQKEGIHFLIHWVSFKNSFEDQSETLAKNASWLCALHILRDADRLDALGAIGLARAFHYGGFKNRLFFDPDILPTQFQTGAAYRKSEAPTLNHFYEKLLRLRDKMHTPSGLHLAEERHQFLLHFLRTFYKEIGHDAPPEGFELESFD